MCAGLSIPLALGIPVKGLFSDIIWRSPKIVSQPSPLSFPYYIYQMFLICMMREFMIIFGMPNLKITSKTSVDEGLELFPIYFCQTPGPLVI